MKTESQRRKSVLGNAAPCGEQDWGTDTEGKHKVVREPEKSPFKSGVPKQVWLVVEIIILKNGTRDSGVASMVPGRTSLQIPCSWNSVL